MDASDQPPSPQPVRSAVYLAQGAWYAIEQAGLLLHDAVLLLERQRSSTALGLAMLSREELGKARILLRVIEQERTDVTLKQIQEELEKHELKQIAGVISVTIPVDDRLFVAGMFQQPDEEGEAAAKELDDRADRIQKRLPAQRLRLRERAFYVDPGEGQWFRPASLSREQASAEVWDANYDYAIFWVDIRKSAKFSWLRGQLITWAERPELPEPPLPAPGVFWRPPPQ